MIYTWDELNTIVQLNNILLIEMLVFSMMYSEQLLFSVTIDSVWLNYYNIVYA